MDKQSPSIAVLNTLEQTLLGHLSCPQSLFRRRHPKNSRFFLFSLHVTVNPYILDLGNLALLVRYQIGPTVDPSHVSIGIYNRRGSLPVVSCRIAVTMHEGPERVRVVTSQEFGNPQQSVMDVLSRHVDELV
jgi:hypothetical protein